MGNATGTGDTIAKVFDAAPLSRAELSEYGRSRRDYCPVASHGDWKPAGSRPDPIEILRAQESIRTPELIPIRYGRMAESPFRFFRGSAAIMAWDLAQTRTSGVNVQACCDAHIHNFGMYASPERRVVFDINDFDETLPAPWEFDVKRLAASIVLECNEANFDAAYTRDAVRTAIGRYCKVLRKLSCKSSLDIHYEVVDEHSFFEAKRNKTLTKYARKNIKKARNRTRHQAYRKWCTRTNGRFQFVEDPPLLKRLPDEAAEHFHKLFNHYRTTLQTDRQHALREYRFRDAARRVVGVGSVGLGAYVLLLEGKGDQDPLIIQIKEATSSVFTPFIGRSGCAHHGERVVQGQRLMQAASDPFLGWVPSGNKDYYVRQLRDMKGKADMPTDPELYLADIELTGGTLARAHARSVDPGLLAGYLGGTEDFAQAITSFAFNYAEQAERDHARLLHAVKLGQVEAEHGI